MKEILNILLKSPTREAQKQWAENLARRLNGWSLPGGATAHACGWSPGCEPLLQFRRLEWVELRAVVSPEVTLSHTYYADDPPCDMKLMQDALELAERRREFFLGECAPTAGAKEKGH